MNLSVSVLFVKLLGLILAVVGLALLLTAVGLNLGLGVHAGSVLLDLVLGLVFLAVGAVLVRGGVVTL